MELLVQVRHGCVLLEDARLSVFVEAPAGAIDAIIARHATVRDLVQHEWLFLHRIDSSSGAVWQRGRDGWHATDGTTLA